MMDELIRKQDALDVTMETVFVEYEDTDPRKEESIILQTKAAIRDGIKALPPVCVPDMNVGKWIPVSERLPEEEGHYLVTDDSGGEKWVDSSVFLRSDDGSVYWDFVNVTAWMPLPEPWKGEAE